MDKFTFEVHILTPEDNKLINSICVSDKCLFAKNSKHGEFWKSQWYVKQEGCFQQIAGTTKYPALIPKNDKVVLLFTQFPWFPKLKYTESYPYIQIKNIKLD